jgi:hypothetical protein
LIDASSLVSARKRRTPRLPNKIAATSAADTLAAATIASRCRTIRRREGG